MGYWIDLSDAYRTMDPDYVESVWWALKRSTTRGCSSVTSGSARTARGAAPPLSDHEMGQPDVYREVTDPSVTVRFPVSRSRPARTRSWQAPTCWSGRRPRGRWCPTPPSRSTPRSTYVVARKAGHGDKVVVAEALWRGSSATAGMCSPRVRGTELIGAKYTAAVRDGRYP